jgi:hypothetical protein
LLGHLIFQTNEGDVAVASKQNYYKFLKKNHIVPLTSRQKQVQLKPVLTEESKQRFSPLVSSCKTVTVAQYVNFVQIIEANLV